MIDRPHLHPNKSLPGVKQQATLLQKLVRFQPSHLQPNIINVRIIRRLRKNPKLQTGALIPNLQVLRLHNTNVLIKDGIMTDLREITKIELHVNITTDLHATSKTGLQEITTIDLHATSKTDLQEITTIDEIVLQSQSLNLKVGVETSRRQPPNPILLNQQPEKSATMIGTRFREVRAKVVRRVVRPKPLMSRRSVVKIFIFVTESLILGLSVSICD